MYCSNCGSEVPEDSSFCKECGTPVTAEAEATESDAPAGATESDAAVQVTNQEAPEAAVEAQGENQAEAATESDAQAGQEESAAADQAQDAQQEQSQVELAEDVVSESEESAPEQSADFAPEAAGASEFAQPVPVQDAQQEQPEPAAPKKKRGPAGAIIAAAAVFVLGFAFMFGYASYQIDNAPAAMKVASDMSNGVAATVNGTAIGEQNVTDYVQAVRGAMNLSDDQAWADWLEQSGLTPEAVRSQSVQHFAEMILLYQAAEEQDVSADPEKVDEQLANLKAQYGGDEAWNAALAAAGTTEAEVRENCELMALEEAITTKLTDAAPEAAKASAANEWLSDFFSKADYKLNEMPAGLPYAAGQQS